MKAVWALLLVLLAPVSAPAQDYPTHNVIFVVPTGPGAATDLLARILAPRLSERLGKPIGLVPAGSMMIPQLQAFVRSEIVRWGEVVKRSGATVD